MISFKGKICSLLLVSAVLFFHKSSLAQSEDLNLWSRIAVKYDLSDKTRLAFEQELRLNENLARFDDTHTELGVSYDFNDHWEGGIYYRFVYENNPDRFYSIGHRGWLQLEYSNQWSNIKASLRNRFQSTYTDINSSDNGKNPDSYNRTKLKLAIDPAAGKKIEPYASIEFWYLLDKGVPGFIDQSRGVAGIEYKHSRNVRWDFFYAYQRELQVNRRDVDHIIGIGYTYLIR